MNTTRRSYEAHVLLVPLGAGAVRLQDAFTARGIEGVMTTTTARGSNDPAAEEGSGGAGGAGLRSVPLGGHGWRPPSDHRDCAALVRDADMVVLLATDLTEVPTALCTAAADAARAEGALIAALLVGTGTWDTPRGNTAMAALREAADMLVSVRGPELAAPFLDVLRGGARESAGVREPAGGREPAGVRDAEAREDASAGEATGAAR